MEGEAPAYSQRKISNPEISTPELRKQIGKELKSAREFQEMSLEQVMAITKINVRFLESIEEGRWSFLPPTYVKAFIRAYSAAVGLQTDKLSNRLDELFQNYVVAAATFRPQFQDEAAENKNALRGKGLLSWIESNRAIVFYTLVGVIAAVLVVLYLRRSEEPGQAGLTEGRDTAIARMEQPIIEASPQPADTAVKTALSPVDSVAAPEFGKTISLDISVRDTCYVKIEHSDSTVYERTLWPGNDLNMNTPHPIKLSLGNAPKANIKIDGQQLPPFPSSRKVQIVNLGPGGIIG